MSFLFDNMYWLSCDTPRKSVVLSPMQGLKEYLRQQRSWLVTIQQSTGAVAGEGDSAAQTALLSGLVTGLLKCCDTESSLPVSREAQQTCAQCLGMVGAIDPARLQVRLSGSHPHLVECLASGLVRKPSTPLPD